MGLQQRVRDGTWRAWRELRLELSLMLLLLAIFGLFEAATQSFWGDAPDFLKALHLFIGNWVIWVWFLAFLGFLAGLWYTYDSLMKRREFRKLIDTTSKQKLLRNRDRLEVLAFILPRAYEMQLQKKMVELEVT